MTPLIAGLGTQELILILLVLVLLFGATKLPELARGTGRALRIFKAETKGLTDDDDDDVAPLEVQQKKAELDAKQAELDAERAKLNDTAN
ncbi:twin-arginine translocase TatA/TatE family subunit [Nocardioides sp. Kera G14]|uniref:twin-arginine translocase TatA/TatE family subunit n=1 Tax=Nocardioides sp. Kera G14 TaxID=2884264 RepID=UPI0039EF8F9E